MSFCNQRQQASDSYDFKIKHSSLLIIEHFKLVEKIFWESNQDMQKPLKFISTLKDILPALL